jgi:hypothetical protein
MASPTVNSLPSLSLIVFPASPCRQRGLFQPQDKEVKKTLSAVMLPLSSTRRLQIRCSPALCWMHPRPETLSLMAEVIAVWKCDEFRKISKCAW